MNRHLSAIAMAAAAVWSTQSAFAQTAPAPAPVQAPPAREPAATAAPAPVQEASAAAAPAATAELEKQIAVQRADIDEQDARIQDLEQALKALKQAAAPPPPKAALAKPAPPAIPPLDESLQVRGYVQAQYESHQDSEDQLLPGGTPLNQNRFLIRRARIRLDRLWKYGGVMIELDANTVRGPAIGIQHAEVSLAYRNPDHTPLVSGTIGLFDNPFGREVVESPRERVFMERSYASRAFFPAEPDLGARASGQVDWFRYSVAVVNGQPLGDRTGFILQDPNNHKDVLGRVGVAVNVKPKFRVSGGVSVLNGRGFHAGSDATKNTITWRDIDENGQFSLGEFQGVPGVAAVASKNFERWLVGADLALELESKFGKSLVAAELSAGSNMDRNVFIADPVTTGVDQREIGYYIAVVQEFPHGAIAGLRFDSYNPNSDFLDSQAGKAVPTSQTVRTFSPVVGFQVPHRARLVFQYDFIHDALARDAAGIPTDKKNNTWTLRLQGEL
ncbi:MAG: hypothetical protein WDO69_28410 [Pseudomonadota bacterium]